MTDDTVKIIGTHKAHGLGRTAEMQARIRELEAECERLKAVVEEAKGLNQIKDKQEQREWVASVTKLFDALSALSANPSGNKPGDSKEELK